MALIQTALLPLALLFGFAAGDGWLGVLLNPETERVTIDEVVPGSPAQKAGLKAGDVFVSVGERRITSVSVLQEAIGSRDAGDTVVLNMQRGEKRFVVKVKLATRPAEGAAPPRVAEGRGGRPARPGATAPVASGKAYAGVRIDESTLEVLDVVQGGPAAKAGIRKGDKIRGAGGSRIRTLAELDRMMVRARPGMRVTINVQRGERMVAMPLTFGRAGATSQPAKKKPAKSQPKKSQPKKELPKKEQPKKKPAKKEQPKKKPAKKEQPKQKPAKSEATTERRAPVARVNPRRAPDRTAAAASTGFGTNFRAALATARVGKKPVFAMFGAGWCSTCRAQKKVFASGPIKRALSAFVRVYVDTDENGRLADEYSVVGLPHLIVLDSSGKKIAAHEGYLPADRLGALLTKGLPKAGGGALGQRRDARRATDARPRTERRPDRRPARADAPRRDTARRAAPRRDPVRRDAPRPTRARDSQSEVGQLRDEIRQLRKELAELKALLREMSKQRRR